MNKVRASITSFGLSVLLAACGGGTTSTQGGSGGSGGDQSGGSGGNQSGGSGGNQSGGSGGNQSGGSGGNQSGGSGGNQSGGSGGNQSGGSGGNQSGGSGGNQSGGSGGNQSGGSGGTQSGGTTTSGSGGSGGGGTTGTVNGTGGSTQGTGGAPGTGGATTAQPAVYTSTNGSCVSGSGITWTPGTLSTSTANATVTVNDSSESQTWEGMGGCFNEKGWQYLQQLSQADRDRAIQLLFAADGAHFNMGRIPMGASDYAIARYTDDEVSGTDTSMSSFNTTQDDKNVIPYIKAALAVRSDIKFWASPWTPPTWMKTGPFTATTDDNATTSSNFDSGNMADVAANLTAYAQYFVKFIAAYKTAGINISVVAPQNEPNYALHYPSCIWTSALFTKFVGQYLGPALKDTGVSIMVGTLSNSDSGKDVDLGNAVLADSTAKSFVTVAGVQWNVLDKVNGGTTFGGLPIWATEHKCGNYPWNGATGCGDGSSTSCPAYNSSKAPNDQAYAVESWYQLRNAISKGKVTAYNAWNMVLDTVGNGIDTHRAWNQDALLAVNTSSKALVVTPAYCVFRHFSQFVVPGAKRVATSGGDAVAFKNPDGHIVAIMYNSGSANSSYVVSIGGQKYQFSMPAQGWATVVN